MKHVLKNIHHEYDLKHILHPYAEFPRFLSEGSRVFDRAEGAYVYDVDGKKYLDGIGGLWCVNIGYGRQEMADAIAEQVLTLPYYNTFTDMSSVPASALAAKLAQLAPAGLNHVFFTTGGSTSADTAVRLAHYYFQANGQPAKKLIIARESAYHGSTYLAASITGIERNYAGFHNLATDEAPLVHHVSCPNVYRPFDGMSEAEYCDALIAELEAKINELGADNTACFFAEPIMGAGGVIMAPDGYHRRALEVCRRHDILYVSDEVVTAFGRLGHIFASESMFDITPDIILAAKGITSGYIPLGATLFSDRIYRTIIEDGVFSHGFTYSGHPVACAAGLKNIEIIEREDLCGHVRETGPYFERALATLADLNIVGSVRGRRFMLAVEFVRDKATKQNFDTTVEVGRRVAMEAYRRGLVARNIGDFIILSPPLTLTKDQINWIVETLRASILAVMNDLRSAGGSHRGRRD